MFLGDIQKFFFACLGEAIDDWLSGINCLRQALFYRVGCDCLQFAGPTKRCEHSNQSGGRSLAVVSKFSRLIVEGQQVMVLWPIADRMAKFMLNHSSKLISQKLTSWSR